MIVTTDLDLFEIERIDELAAERGMTRETMLAFLVLRGMEQEEQRALASERRPKVGES